MYSPAFSNIVININHPLAHQLGPQRLELFSEDNDWTMLTNPRRTRSFFTTLLVPAIQLNFRPPSHPPPLSSPNSSNECAPHCLMLVAFLLPTAGRMVVSASGCYCLSCLHRFFPCEGRGKCRAQDAPPRLETGTPYMYLYLSRADSE